MFNETLRTTLLEVARFYDQRRVGDVGHLGFRRSSDLIRLVSVLDQLMERQLLEPWESLFLDMGCADGRVNVLLSYIVKKSIGVELDEWTLDEYMPLRKDLEIHLSHKNLRKLPLNISLFHGDVMDKAVHTAIKEQTRIRFEQYDLFYTYLTMQEEFAGMIAQQARKGAVYMVYGVERIIPRHEGLRLLTPDNPLEGIVAVYQKT